MKVQDTAQYVLDNCNRSHEWILFNLCSFSLVCQVVQNTSFLRCLKGVSCFCYLFQTDDNILIYENLCGIVALGPQMLCWAIMVVWSCKSLLSTCLPSWVIINHTIFLLVSDVLQWYIPVWSVYLDSCLPPGVWTWIATCSFRWNLAYAEMLWEKNIVPLMKSSSE